MPKADGDATLLIQSLNKAYAATPTNLKIIDLYVVFAVVTALVQVGYMGIVGSLPFNSFLSGVLSCIGTAVLAACLRIQVNKDNKEFKKGPLQISSCAIWCSTWLFIRPACLSCTKHREGIQFRISDGPS
ncbi:dolichyl-diphosphooligosaccharide--protein glycosyltransferase subunit DAD1-like isoform X7 [Triticum dicoccoides]|uniref:dolichyl-diphosphooligosaccharide--protein glycosyltransferase subunit DAD1-like isoform X7 n=1 Tax=Triticum dicoccoides TaxID=85692 RepID=UPI001890E9CB|nr:dolichyl-diphosphooligosaccharide--protein glycosyltransferase subunit DAD1-like isoform X7 [Triticum dicoccoides]XP_044434403.1 dolichyl-diphosphooligosaccharide--protein glycosyltransferase subunit DAD1-like isoform X7 [Triticum aestivum]